MFHLFMEKYEAKFTKMETYSCGSTFTTFLKRIINAGKSEFSTLYFKTSTHNIFIFLGKKVTVLSTRSSTRSVTGAPPFFQMLKNQALSTLGNACHLNNMSNAQCRQGQNCALY